MKCVIGICDQNMIYMKRLAEYIRRKEEDTFQVIIFSDTESMVRFLEKEHLNVLIAGEEVWSQCLSAEDDFHVPDKVSIELGVILVETDLVQNKRNMADEGSFGFCSKILYFNRYCSGLELFQAIKNTGVYEIHDRRGQKAESSLRKSAVMQEENLDSYVIGIYSPNHRCGKTSMAVLISELLQNNTDESLYICMDRFSEYFSADEFNVSELIFKADRIHMQTSNAAEAEKYFSQIQVEPYIRKKQKFSYIPSSSLVEDLGQIDGMLFSDVLKILRQHGKYKWIIVDMPEWMENIQTVLAECTHVFMPVKKDCSSQSKLRQFRHLMGCEQKRTQWDIVKSHLFEVYLPETPEADYLENYYEELAWSEFGYAVKSILSQHCIG